ncbi:hypothetical protein Leryth_021401 [Lithospermum erythrorhizon]|nr:hypothetical protein Leryth_021401 [Lithospermum erythrorhizon]
MGYLPICSSLFLCFISYAILVSSSTLQDPDHVVQQVHRSINESISRRNLGYLSCRTGNPIDDCWRCDPNWEKNRQSLADCAIGFGKGAMGGKNGRIYVVTDSGNDDPENPRPGTLRHATIQNEPLWIIFKRDMIIQLKKELLINSYKTIDGRGASVHIASGPCIKIHYKSNIIIHGIHIHDCKQGGGAIIRDSPEHKGWWKPSDGDAIAIFGGRDIWVDHCSLSSCEDGLIDAIHGSTATENAKVQTWAFKVVNNDYTIGNVYAIEGVDRKQVTKHEDAPESAWRNWNWRSEGDLMLNGAYFLRSGAGGYRQCIMLEPSHEC